jgi:hypothetical protein
MIAASDFKERKDTGPGLALPYPAQALLYENPVVMIQGYDIGQAKGIDIDSELDFRIVEVLMRERESLPA